MRGLLLIRRAFDLSESTLWFLILRKYPRSKLARVHYVFRGIPLIFSGILKILDIRWWRSLFPRGHPRPLPFPSRWHPIDLRLLLDNRQIFKHHRPWWLGIGSPPLIWDILRDRGITWFSRILRSVLLTCEVGCGWGEGGWVIEVDGACPRGWEQTEGACIVWIVV